MDTNMPKVTVVVPAYNVELYIEDAINSILTQSLIDLEVIVVDDYGTDGTCLKVEKLAKKDSRVHIVKHAENKGLSAARNSGINASRGQYILLLDGDDLIASDDVVMKLYNQIKVYDSDIVRSQMSYYMEDKNKIIEDYHGKRDFGVIVYNTDVLSYPNLLNHKTSWLFMYKKSFLEERNLKFCEFLRRREDMAFVYDCLLRTHKISLCPVVSHHYRQRAAQDSICDNPDFSDFILFVKQIEHVFSIRKSNSIVYDGADLDLIFKGIAARYIGAVDKIWIPAARKFDKNDQGIFVKKLLDVFSVYNFKDFDFTAWSFLDAIDQTKLTSGYYDLFAELISSCDQEKLFKFLRNELTYGDLVSICTKRGLTSSSIQSLDRQLYKHLIGDEKKSSVPFPLAPKEIIEANIPLYIHIGSTKAGSTSIQNWFYDNRAVNYHDSGLYFPYAGLTYDPERADRMSGHHNLFVSLLKGGALLEKLYEELSALESLPTKLILSCENLTYGEIWFDEENIEMLKHAFSCFDIKIIYYVRPQHEWLNSMYGESVCGGWQMYTRSCMDFYRRESAVGRTDYHRIASLWANVFGLENIVVNRFERDAFPRGVVNDFLDSIGESTLVAPVSFQSNVSLGESFISTARLCNLFDIPLKKHQEFVAKFEEVYVSNRMQDSRSDFYSYDQKKLIVVDHDLSNSLLAKEFLCIDELWTSAINNPSSDEDRTRNINDKILETGLKIFIKIFKEAGSLSSNKNNNASPVKNDRYRSLSDYKLSSILNLMIKAEDYFRNRSHARIIKKSKLFHENWYLDNYPDVKSMKIKPVEHYIKHGANEGRNPSPMFNTNNYISGRPDVRKSGVNPLLHYILHGNRGR